MHPEEFHWLMELKKPHKEYGGGMTEQEVAAIYEQDFGEPDYG